MDRAVEREAERGDAAARTSEPLLDGPDWVGEVAREPWVERARSMVGTLVAFSLRPTAFARAWVAGSRASSNPFFAMAAAVSLLTPVTQELARVTAGGVPKTLVWSFVTTAGPFVYYVCVGLLAHAFLRLSGGPPRIRSSIAMSLYAGGGPGMVASLVVSGIFFGLHAAYGETTLMSPGVPPGIQLACVALIAGLYAWFLWTLTASLAAVHGVGRWRSGVALLTAVLLAGVPLGLLETAGVSPSVGFHFTLLIQHDAQWHVAAAITL